VVVTSSHTDAAHLARDRRVGAVAEGERGGSRSVLRGRWGHRDTEQRALAIFS
jgi:hypothetical protein